MTQLKGQKLLVWCKHKRKYFTPTFLKNKKEIPVISEINNLKLV